MNKFFEFNWDGAKFPIRASSVDSFYGCPLQWAKVFIGKEISIPGARAAIGTAIHKGVEEMWLEAQIHNSKEHINLSMMEDAAIQKFQEDDQEFDLHYDNGEDLETAQDTVLSGVKAFVDDIVPFTDIPTDVEQQYTIQLDHDVAEALSGTIDYARVGEVSDVKTSKRKPVPESYVVQQTLYKLLREDATGIPVTRQTIQGVALTKNPAGHILELEPKVEKTKFLFNTLLDTLQSYYAGADPSLLFRGNPKYYLCSIKYCGFYTRCPYTQGDM